MTPDIYWWLTAIEIPVIAALYVRLEELAQAKLSIAQTYAQRSQVRELEERITAHLLRIERKLDATSLQTAALTERSK